jgi:diaminopimelate decarboxylase
MAKKTADLAQRSLATINLGGGFGIPYFAHEKELDLEALLRGASELIAEARSDRRLAAARFVVEPGRFLAGPAGIYVARIRSVKACRGTTFVILDGGSHHNLAASGVPGQTLRRDYPIINLSRESGPESTVVVVGPLCSPHDTLGRKVVMPLPRAGDLIGILQSGAYGLTASPVEFLSHPVPAEVLMRPGEYEVITPRKSRFALGRGATD